MTGIGGTDNWLIGTGYTHLWPNGGTGWYYFSGSIDEVRISNTARSADWIITEYNNQSSPGTFYTVGSSYAP